MALLDPIQYGDAATVSFPEKDGANNHAAAYTLQRNAIALGVRQMI